MEQKKQNLRFYNYESRVMWNTALPLVANRRENNHLKNIERVKLFDELGYYKKNENKVVHQETKGGRGVRGLTVEMVELLLAQLGTDEYMTIIKNLFINKYMTSREVKYALKHCSAIKGETLSDNEITLIIKKWV